MAQLLRIVRKNRWYPPEYPDWPKRPKSAFQADAFLDLRTEHNELSLWRVDTPNRKLQLNRIIAALAANREKLDVFDYALISMREAEKVGIELNNQAEEVPDQEAKWFHVSITELTGYKLYKLAKLIRATNNIQRISKKDVKELILASIIEGYILPEAIKQPGIRRELNLPEL